MRAIFQLFIQVFIFLYGQGIMAQSPCGYTSSTDTLPSKCLEIQSILVNACTNTEGFDEMVRVKIGPYPIALNTISNVQWASGNPWQGWASFNVVNLGKLATINTTISNANNCGRVIKVNPTDTIPAYSHLLIVTSTLFNALAHDFSALTDTLYVALQNNSTIANGHFINTTDHTLRRLIIGINTGCSDTVDHYGHFMIKSNGSLGSEDGSGVEFTIGGSAKYFNNGCKTLSSLFKVEIVKPLGTYCSGDTISLAATIVGAKCFYWYPKSKVNGYFIDSTSSFAQFVVPPKFEGNLILFLKGIGSCSTKIDSIEIVIHSGVGPLHLQTDSSMVRCNLNSLQLSLNANGTNPVIWFHDGKGILTALDSMHQIYFPSLLDTQIVHLSVMQTSLCRSSHDTISVQFCAPPKAMFSVSDSMICLDESNIVQLMPQQVGGQFYGHGVIGTSFIPDTPGIYPISHTISLGGCSDSSVVQIHVFNKPDAFFTLSDSTVCTHEKLIAFNTHSPNGVWHGVLVTNDTFVPLSEGKYHVTYVIDNGACVDSMARNILVGDRPNSSFSIPDTLLCVHDPAIQIIPEISGGQFKGSNISGTIFDPIIPGVFDITYIVSHLGCTDSTLSKVRVAPLPLATFVVTPETTWVQSEVTFTYTGSPVVAFNWEYGDGTRDTMPLTSKHLFTRDNFYQVGLTVTSIDGCVSSTMRQVMVLSEESLFVPTAFTPNGDLNNETFHLSYANVHQFNLSIYNKWGELVFHVEDPDLEWDGTFNGHPCSEGVYTYRMNYSTLEGHQRNLKGTVTLLR